MTTSEAVESFWIQLAESGLVPAPQVESLARQFSNEEVTSDSEAARKLMQMGLLTRYQAERLLEGRSRGFFFDQYKLLDLLGVGGMGWVYRAAHTETGELFALKVLIDQFKNDHGMLARFDQEARAGLRFRHENIVRTYSCGSAGGLPYVIMEFVEGPSLLELLKLRERMRLPWEQACDIARQAALGLHVVHLAGFVHRDVKPQNVLIDHEGHVKLLDFGLAMFREGESGDEFSMAMIFGHECVGTAAFTAPEQATDSLSADARSDVYSLGCTLYAMLTGDTPFPYSDVDEVLKGHQTKVPRNVCEIVPSIPQPVGEIIAKMLAKKPEDRYATAKEVADALAVWGKCQPVEFDFARILKERTKSARDKLAAMRQRRRSPSGAANSTANPATISSVTTTSASDMPEMGMNNRLQSSSVARRDPFGFENPPAIRVRPSKTTPQSDQPAVDNNTPKSGMALLPLNGGEPILLPTNRLVIGRGGACDMQIQDQSVSSRHCEIQYDGKQWTIVDLNSRNGVRVNGDMITKHVLKRGDTIIIGNSLRLRFGDINDKHLTQFKAPTSSSRWLTYTVITLIAALSAAVIWFWLTNKPL